MDGKKLLEWTILVLACALFAGMLFLFLEPFVEFVGTELGFFK